MEIIVTDKYSNDYYSIKGIRMAIAEAEKGCGDHIDEDNAELGSCQDGALCDYYADLGYCQYGALCDYCRDEIIADLTSLLTEFSEKEDAVWDDACEEFVARAGALGFDPDTLSAIAHSNYTNGAYKSSHGRCAETIMEAWDGESLDMHDEEIVALAAAMGAADSRHNDTDYDDMRSSGISRDNAREYVR